MKILSGLKEKSVLLLKNTVVFVTTHKATSSIVISAFAVIAAAAIFLTCILSAPKKDAAIMGSAASAEAFVSGETTSSEAVESVVSSEPTVSSKPSVSSKPAVNSTPTVTPAVNTDFKYNSSMNYNDNVFLDALTYTGYKLDTGRMWGARKNYVLCSQKRGLGWLSNITYGGGSSGYEVDAQGKPNISKFERSGLVCATYVTYAYFNYLPNVAGIDTSSLTKPNRSYSANDWYIAAKDWVNKGYSKYISFTANDNGSISNDIKFTPSEDIPIGSIICMQDWYNRNGHCSHVSIYAGYINGYHWVTHVGNENGPEFCAMERMNRKPHPQWPLAIITTPGNIRFTPALEVTVTDNEGNPVVGAQITAKYTANSTVIELGKTDQSGKLIKEGLSYGEYQIIQNVPAEYTCDSPTATISLNTKNNSLNSVAFTNTKVVIPEAVPVNSDTSNTVAEASTVSE